MRLHLRRALLGLTTTAVLASGTLVAAPAEAASGGRSGQTVGWLVRGLDDGLLHTTFQGTSYPNYGTTLDAAAAFQALDVRPKQRRQVLKAFDADPNAYIGAQGRTSAGALGKLLTVVQQQGIAPTDFAQGGLRGRLERRVQDSGNDAGRATDATATDYSNTVTQSFVVRALSLAGSDLADETTAYLLEQQCSDGFFRLYLDSADGTCDGGTAQESAPSVDATAFAVLALKQARASGVTGVQADARAALKAARRWLVSEQARNGSFGDAGTHNSNTTGLAAQALDALGKSARAKDAARWVAHLRVTKKLVRKTALKPRDLGAVAYTRGDLKTAKRKGLKNKTLFTWQSASAQAASSLGLLG